MLNPTEDLEFCTHLELQGWVKRIEAENAQLKADLAHERGIVQRLTHEEEVRNARINLFRDGIPEELPAETLRTLLAQALTQKMEHGTTLTIPWTSMATGTCSMRRNSTTI